MIPSSDDSAASPFSRSSDAKHMIKYVNVVIYSYQYLLDLKVAGILSKEMPRECVVVFTEPHCINNAYIEAGTGFRATRNLSKMNHEIDRYVFICIDPERFNEKFSKLLSNYFN